MNQAKQYSKPSEEELKVQFTPEQYRVTQKNGTEAPFHNAFFNHRGRGIYVDVVTGEPLFLSSDKFDSGCGWPAFSKPVENKAVKEKRDSSFGMERTEVRSAQGDSHLGHVFTDGPLDKGGLRYCINSAALRFVPYDEMEEEGYGQWKSKIENGK